MDLNDTPEQAFYRREVREWLQANRALAPPRSGSYEDGAYIDARRAWQRRLAEAGLAGCQAQGPDDVHRPDGRRGRDRPRAAPDLGRGRVQRGVFRRPRARRGRRQYYAGWARAAKPDEFPLAASAARSVAAKALDFAARAMINVHGGIGATWEHDAPLFFRRAQLSRRLLGGLTTRPTGSPSSH